MVRISENEILIFGSGSKSPEREVCVLVELDKELTYKQYNISPFYDPFRAMKNMESYQLNIEGVTFDGESVYLFNRGRNIYSVFLIENLLTIAKRANVSRDPKPIYLLYQNQRLASWFFRCYFFKEESYFILVLREKIYQCL